MWNQDTPCLLTALLSLDLLGGLDFGCFSPCTLITAMVLSLLDHAEQSAKRCSARQLMVWGTFYALGRSMLRGLSEAPSEYTLECVIDAE
jgi:hypothetical protein